MIHSSVSSRSLVSLPFPTALLTTPERTVPCADMDCFYCACERALQALTPAPLLCQPPHAVARRLASCSSADEPSLFGPAPQTPMSLDQISPLVLCPQPSLLGVPLAVVQYNPFQGDGSASDRGVVSLPAEPATARVAIKDGKVHMPAAANGSIIAVSYEARKRGVTRFFRAREALAVCPELVVVQAPPAHPSIPDPMVQPSSTLGSRGPCRSEGSPPSGSKGHAPGYRRYILFGPGV